MTGTKLKPPSRNGSVGYDNLLPEFGSKYTLLAFARDSNILSSKI